jgi:hypothetical protein
MNIFNWFKKITKSDDDKIDNQTSSIVLPINSTSAIAVDTRANLVHNVNPAEVIQDAARIASVLADLINKRKLYTVVKGNKYVHVEGWGLMMAMLKVSPHITKCEKLERGAEIAYEAEVELLSQEGKLIGRASAICSSKEDHKSNQPEYAIRSMAQTRAVGKASRLSFGWIMKLSGYEPTPSDEMDVSGTPPQNSVPMSNGIERARNNLANNLRAAIA